MWISIKYKLQKKQNCYMKIIDIREFCTSIHFCLEKFFSDKNILFNLLSQDFNIGLFINNAAELINFTVNVFCINNI